MNQEAPKFIHGQCRKDAESEHYGHCAPKEYRGEVLVIHAFLKALQGQEIKRKNTHETKHRAKGLGVQDIKIP